MPSRFHSLLLLSILINDTPSRNYTEPELRLENATPIKNDNKKIPVHPIHLIPCILYDRSTFFFTLK